MTWTTKLFHFIVDGFRPPFRTAHWMVLAYVILSAIYNPNSSFNHWVLPDTDDYTRFVQVFNWLDGQSWFDMRVPHLYPNHVISMHWARLVDIPLAGLIILFEFIAHFFQLDTTRTGIAMMAAFIIPCFLLFALLKLVRAMARPMLGRRYAGLACFMVPLSMQLIFQFSPMRVDHHAYILIGAGLGFMALQNMALGIRPKRMAILAGLTTGLAMWNGAEILPMLLGIGFCMTLLMIISRRPKFLDGVVFGASLLLANVLILLVAKAPDVRWTTEYDSYSFFYVIMAGYTCAFFIALYACSKITKNTAILLSFALCAALVDLSFFLNQFPDFIAGPYAKVHPLLNQVFFPTIREAVPFFKAWQDLGDNFATTPNQAIGGAIYYMTTRLFAPTIATLTCLYQITRERTSQKMRLLWMLYAFFTVFFTGLALFWQVRVITYAQLISLIPLLWLMLRCLKTLPLHYQGRMLFGWEVMTVLSFTMLPTLIIPAIIMGSKLNPDVMFYLGNSSSMPCKDRIKVISYLQNMQETKKITATIMAQMDYTPEFMFYTNHNYIAAPYHRNDRGIADMVIFFRSQGDDIAARTIAKNDDLDYVLVCKASYYAGTLRPTHEIKNISINVTLNGIESRPEEQDVLNASLAMRLAYDKTPLWLEFEQIPFENDFALYKVRKDILGKPTAYAKKQKL
jgi:hypothetical protein